MTQKLIWTFFYLAIIGVIVSIISITIPWFKFGFLNPALISTSGDIASGIAATFGLGLAAIALLSYVWSESIEKKAQDEIWTGIITLLSAFKTAKLMLDTYINPRVNFVEDPEENEKYLAEATNFTLNKLQETAEKSLTPIFLKWYNAECRKFNPNADENLLERFQFVLRIDKLTGDYNTALIQASNEARSTLEQVKHSSIKTSKLLYNPPIE